MNVVETLGAGKTHGTGLISYGDLGWARQNGWQTISFAYVSLNGQVDGYTNITPVTLLAIFLVLTLISSSI